MPSGGCGGGTHAQRCTEVLGQGIMTDPLFVRMIICKFICRQEATLDIGLLV